NVRTIALRENCGKGYAMRVGVENAEHDVLFFCDGDMYVTHQHVEALVRPVVSNQCDMNIGVRHRGPMLNFMHLRLKCGPVLSGIRVMRRHVWDKVPVQYMERFKIEAALNYFCARADLRQQHTIIYELGHVTKESKRGVLEGLVSRWHMSREVTLLLFDLYLFETWRWNEREDEMQAEYEIYE
ncbi:MAG TPA: glycosyltransferase, partial [Thermoanaerobaculia bacterium]